MNRQINQNTTSIGKQLKKIRTRTGTIRKINLQWDGTKSYGHNLKCSRKQSKIITISTHPSTRHWWSGWSSTHHGSTTGTDSLWRKDELRVVLGRELQEAHCRVRWDRAVSLLGRSSWQNYICVGLRHLAWPIHSNRRTLHRNKTQRLED